MPALSRKNPLYFLSSFLFCFFPREKWVWTFLFNVWLTWCVFNKSACQPYLLASLTVPFLKELVHCDPAVGKTLAEFRFNNRSPFFISVSSLTLRDTYFFSFTPTPRRFPCFVKKKLLRSLNLDGAVFWIPEGQARVGRTCHSLVLSFHNFGYEL